MTDGHVRAAFWSPPQRGGDSARRGETYCTHRVADAAGLQLGKGQSCHLRSC